MGGHTREEVTLREKLGTYLTKGVVKTPENKEELTCSSRAILPATEVEGS